MSVQCPSCGTDNPREAASCSSCHEPLTLHGKRKVGEETLQNMETISPEEISSPSNSGDMPLRTVRLRQDQLGDRYELKELLGKGGMGVVYRAHDLQLNEDIAIKLLRSEYAESEEDIARFKREIKTARRINSDFVIRIHDIGMADEELFISMELLTGGTLSDRMKKSHIPTDEALDISIGVAEGLAAAHKKGVIHRDIKPHNVLFDAQGHVKLVDFGIARLSASTSHTVGVTGTPHYMSPEIADGAEINARSDVYSCGVLLYQLFTGELPFKANTLVRLAMMHAHDLPEPPRKVRADIPEEIEAVILRCLEKRPSDRFEDARELANALKAIRGDAPATSRLSRSEVIAPPQPPSRMGLWLGISGAIVLVLAVGLWVTRKTMLAQPTPTPEVTQVTVTPVTTEAMMVINVLDARTGDLIPKARVLAAGQELCHLPCTNLPVPEAAEIEVRAPGYENKTVSIAELEPNDNNFIPLNVELTPKPRKRTPTPTAIKTSTPRPTPVAVRYGALTVNAEPWVRVFVDGKKVANETPLREFKLPAGRHQLRMVHPKGEFTRTVEVPPNGNLNVFVNVADGDVKVW